MENWKWGGPNNEQHRWRQKVENGHPGTWVSRVDGQQALGCTVSFSRRSAGHCELPGEGGPPSLAMLPKQVRELGQLLVLSLETLQYFQRVLLFQWKVGRR